MVVLDRKERDKQLRKADILKAAEHIFASKGYHEATIQDIAKEAQYGTGTVYLYFKDKSALYFSLLEEKMKSMSETVQKKAEDIKDARKRLEVFIQEGLVFFEENQDFFHIFMHEKNSLQLIVGKKATESFIAIGYITDYVEELVKMAQKQGVIRKDYAPAEVADIYMSVMGSLILNWAKSGSKRTQSLAGRSGFVLDVFLNGVGTK
jgi:AcrR family transcriptional regulator